MNRTAPYSLEQILAKFRRTGADFEMASVGEAGIQLLQYITEVRPDFIELPALLSKYSPLFMNAACAYDLGGFVQRYAEALQVIARNHGTHETELKFALDAELGSAFAQAWELTLLVSALQHMTLRCLRLPSRKS